MHISAKVDEKDTLKQCAYMYTLYMYVLVSSLYIYYDLPLPLGRSEAVKMIYIKMNIYASYMIMYVQYIGMKFNQILFIRGSFSFIMNFS